MHEKEIYAALQRVLNKHGEMNKVGHTYGTDTTLYISEIHLIECVGESTDVGITELAQKLGVSCAAVSRTVSKLVSKKMLKKKINPVNRREICIQLTPLGREAFWGHRRYHEEKKQEYVDYYMELDAAQQKVILDFLNFVYDNFKRNY